MAEGGRGLTLMSAVVGILIAMGMAQAQEADETMMRLIVQMQFGRDLGQSPGSLFEARIADGRFVIGAGFCDVFNTRFRTDRDVVQFFVRRTDGERAFTTERLPRPLAEAGSYMFDFGGEVIAGLDAASRTISAWDPATGTWERRESVAPYRMRLGEGTLAWGSRVWYDGELILDAPEQGGRGVFYYAGGHLCFYHIWRGQAEGYEPWQSDETGFSKLYACPWQPGDGPIDPARATVLTLPYVGETSFVWGQFEGKPLTVSNLGGVYFLDGGQWRTLRVPELGVSYQVYSIVRFYDRLLLGQYPSGELWEFDGEAITRLEGWPPRLEGVAAYSREAQTAIVWGGELLVGVWPWAELWRYNPDTGQWHSMGRMFTQPPVHADPGHPWERECEEAGLVINQWGQRLTSLVPLGETLMASTSAKGPVAPEDWPDFIPPEALAEYGAVLRLRLPGCLSARIHWTAQPTELEFALTRERMVIRQQGLELASAPLDAELASALAAAGGIAQVTWGEGAYGPFGGASVSGTAR
ncbi:MAG: hypothetical protein AB7Y46_15375 [Armatimonadota bacterium]